MVQKKIDALVRLRALEVLRKAEKRRLSAPSLYWYENYLDAKRNHNIYATLADQAQFALSVRDYGAVVDFVEEHIGELGIKVGSEEYYYFCREALKAEIAIFRQEAKRATGDYGDEFSLEAGPLAATPPSQLEPAAAPPALPLSEVITQYKKHLETEGGRNQTTLQEYEAACRLLVWILGDKLVTAVTRDDIRTFLAALQALPSHLKNNPKTRDLPFATVRQIVKSEGLPPQSPVAIEKKFQRVKSFMAWARDEGLMEQNVCQGINYRRPRSTKRRQSDEKAAYTLQDIANLVAGLIEERRKGTFINHPERYWIMLIGLFSGLRLEEICQLHTADIREKEGVWCFDVSEMDSEGQRVKCLKNVNAQRLVPIHPTLIDLGLLDYVSEIQRQKAPRLWMALKRNAQGKYQRNIKDWYNGADRRPGFENLYIDDAPAKSFHSLRHTFVTALKEAAVDLLITNELIGHAHGALAFDRYGKSLSLTKKLEAMQKINFHGVEFVSQLGRWRA